MVASFTRAAAVELLQRDLPVERANVGTLHALCYRAMGSPTIAETKLKEFHEAQHAYRLSGDGIDIDEPEQHFDTEADRIFARYQVVRAQMLPRERWEPDVLSFAATWERWKGEAGYVDFTDMIELSLAHDFVPEARIGFFDEVQDFTRLELSLVRKWGEQMEYIILAGDDDQCIYGFKGATHDAFLTPELDAVNKKILDQSYRMPVDVWLSSALWIDQLGSRRENKPFAPRDARGESKHRPDLMYRDAATIVEEAYDAITSGRSESAMIVGACSYMLTPIVSALRERGLLFHNPYRRKRGDWNPLRAARGTTTAQRLLHLLAYDESVHGDSAHAWTYGDLAAWVPLVRKTGVLRRGQWDKLVEGQPADRVVSGSTLAAMFEDGVVDAIRSDPLDWLEDHVVATKASVLKYPMTIARKRGGAALMETPKLIVGTIHSVKGGQADDVYLLPDLSPAGNIEWHDARTRDHTIRQFYVGMTRAKERLFLCGNSSPAAVQWQDED
jgi:superfamily I DNA/RNA helicase